MSASTPEWCQVLRVGVESGELRETVVIATCLYLLRGVHFLVPSDNCVGDTIQHLSSSEIPVWLSLSRIVIHMQYTVKTSCVISKHYQNYY